MVRETLCPRSFPYCVDAFLLERTGKPEYESCIEMYILMDVEHTLVWLLVPSLSLQSGKRHSKASEHNGLEKGS